ncbi:MAG: terpene cyclase/mutase family protein [Pirellula sp.]|jgi:hypothetical protein|nr:terpene cyclase/mutase family protein [Pirellula sp.]
MASSHRFIPTLQCWSIACVAIWIGATWVVAQERESTLAEKGPEPVHVEAPSQLEIESSIERGIAFLAETQNRDGSWGGPTRTKDLNIYAPTPGAHDAFRAGTTALCVAALVDCRDYSYRSDELIVRGEEWLLKHLPHLRRANQDALYNVWGHAYGIEALARLHRYHDGDEGKQKTLLDEIQHQIELLGRYETTKGGWGYYDFHMHLQKPTAEPTSFTTATVLYALHRAREVGADVPQAMIDRGLAVIRRQQRPDLAYLYSDDMRTSPGFDVNKPGGSVGRSQACNYVLRLYGDTSVSDAALLAWAKRLYARNLWLDIGRKRPIPHESWFLVAGYFFYYGHYYAALGLEELPEESQPQMQDQLANVMIRLQEKDGSWWDYPLYNYHQPYGTGFALMTLVRCVREL